MDSFIGGHQVLQTITPYFSPLNTTRDGVMKSKDALTLPAAAQEDLRIKAVKEVREGMPKAQAVRIFSVSRQAIHNWINQYAEGGHWALKARRRGRPAGPRHLNGCRRHR